MQVAICEALTTFRPPRNALSMPSSVSPTTLLVTGGSGGLGRTLIDRWSTKYRCVAPARRELDLAYPEQLEGQLESTQFDILVNCAAIARPDECEPNPELSERVNAKSPAVLAKVAAGRGARMVQISTDFVFEGSSPSARNEEDAANPLSVYGKTKRAAEIAVLNHCPDSLVARVSWLFGSHKPSHPDHVITQASKQSTLTAIHDKWSIPTFSDDLADWLEALIFHPENPSGIYHLAPKGEASWFDWTQATLEIASELELPLHCTEIRPITLRDFPGFKAPRPQYSALSHAKFSALTGIVPEHWRPRLACYLTQHYGEQNASSP